MKLGEGWAYQIFFKNLVPKKAYMETVMVKNEGSNIEARINNVLEKISEFTELTYDEAISEIKTFDKLNDNNLNGKRDIQKVHVSFGSAQDEEEDESS